MRAAESAKLYGDFGRGSEFIESLSSDSEPSGIYSLKQFWMTESEIVDWSTERHYLESDRRSGMFRLPQNLGIDAINFNHIRSLAGDAPLIQRKSSNC